VRFAHDAASLMMRPADMGANIASWIAKRSASFRSEAQKPHQPPQAATSFLFACGE